MEKIDLAVVFYEKEVELLKILANSIEIYCSIELVDTIYFINNSANEAVAEAEFKKHVKPLFKKFSDSVSILNASAFGIDYENGALPYTAQQALKLEFGRITDKSHYMTLDARNHFIRDLRRSDLFSNDNLPVSHLQVHTGYLGICLKESCAYIGIDVDVEEPVLPSVTPYVLITKVVNELLDLVEESEGHNVYGLIAKNNRITEFLLYCAYIMRKGKINDAYALKQKPYATLFTKWPETESDVKRVLESTASDAVWMFSVHIRRFEKLKPSEIEFISELWVERKLFSSKREAKTFIDYQAIAPNIDKGSTLATNSDGKVYEGRGGRLFIANDSNEVIKQHRGERLLSDKQLKAWKYLLEFRKAICSAKAIAYQIMVVPDAHAVHKEQLPLLDYYANARPVHQILDSIDDHSYFNYPLNVLKHANENGEVYHPVDSHYTAYGAYVCYKSLMSNLRRKIDILKDDEIENVTKKSSGDLGEKFEPPKVAEYTDCVVKKATATKVWNNGVTNRGHMSLWINSDDTKPTCVLFTDSYGWKIQRFFAESFSRLYIIHSPLIELEAIDVFKPDFVFSLMAERFLIYPPKDLFDKSAMDFAIEKGGEVKSYEEIKAIRLDK